MQVFNFVVDGITCDVVAETRSKARYRLFLGYRDVSGVRFAVFLKRCRDV